MRSLVSRLSAIAAFAVSFALCTALLDTYVRLSGTESPVVSYYHDEYGLYNKPSQRWVRFKEGFYIGSSTPDSRYGDPYGVDKPPGAYRIALIGDSFVQGVDVLERHHFRTVLENELRARFGGASGPEIQVLNFGRANFNLRYSYYHFENAIRDYEPDLVLYFLESRDVYTPKWSGRTHYELVDGELRANFDWRETTQYRVFRRLDGTPVLRHYIDTALFALARRAVMEFRRHAPGEVLFGKFYTALDGREPEGQAGPEAEPAEQSALSRRIIETLHELERPRVVFVLRPHPKPAPLAEAHLRRLGADYIDLGVLFHDDGSLRSSGRPARYWKATDVLRGHWNHEGHREVGRHLAEQLTARLEGELGPREVRAGLDTR